MKIENQSSIKLPRNTEKLVDKLCRGVPSEHRQNLDRIRLVDRISDPRLKNIPADLPGLYHPRQGTERPWMEIAMVALLAPDKSFFKRLLPRLTYKSNLAGIIFSLIGQHYYLTMRHSVKKTQLEPAVRAYVEKQLRAWNEREHSFRARIFKPFQPTFERWGRALQKKAAAANSKRSS